jgi:hypothetical protein
VDPTGETANQLLLTSVHEYSQRIALPRGLMCSLAISDCRTELTRMPLHHYRFLPAGSTWTIGAIFGVDPGLVPGFSLGVADGARQCRSLGAGAHAQLGEQAVHVILDGMDGDAQLVCDVAVR